MPSSRTRPGLRARIAPTRKTLWARSMATTLPLLNDDSRLKYGTSSCMADSRKEQRLAAVIFFLFTELRAQELIELAFERGTPVIGLIDRAGQADEFVAEILGFFTVANV